MSKRILILGGGQLGSAFYRRLSTDEQIEVKLWRHAEVPYTTAQTLLEHSAEYKPTHVINCSAYTDVDKAESKHEVNPVNYNTLLPLMLAQNSIYMGYKLIHFSTDYVFDGNSCLPYKETDETHPINHYGKSKDAADFMLSKNRRIKTFRVQALYSHSGKCFPNSMKNIASSVGDINVVCDQVTVPTPAGWIADIVIPLLDRNEHGLWNLCPNGETSWADFARYILGDSCVVNDIPSSQYLQKAKRPLYTVLDNTEIKDTFNLEFGHWKEVYDGYKDLD